MHYLVFDTNTYRELGVPFDNNIDFGYLSKFLKKGPHELVLLEVVRDELVDWYRNDVIGKLISEYQSLYMHFEKNPFLETIEIPNLTNQENNALAKYKNLLDQSCWKMIPSGKFESKTAVKFFLHNKRSSKKDNSRDFLIWQNLIKLAEENPEDKIVFIGRDKIFKENRFFQNQLVELRINNIVVLDSISIYMREYGLQVEYLNEEFVLDSIDLEDLKNQLEKSIDDFPSYVSSYYNSPIKPPRNVSGQISELTLVDYYTFSEDKSEIILITSVLVTFKSMYDVETRVNLDKYPPSREWEEVNHRVDEQNRPIYEGKVLFMYEAKLNLQDKTIGEQEFIDFIPDWYVRNN